MLAQILHLLLRKRHPERVLVQHLEARKDELRLRRARGALAHVVGEAEGLGRREEGLDAEEGGALLHRFREDAAAAAGEDVVDSA